MPFPKGFFADPAWRWLNCPVRRNGYRASGRDRSGRTVSVTGDTPWEAARALERLIDSDRTLSAAPMIV